MEFQNLQSLLNRATAPNSEDEAKHYCNRFTTLVNQEPDGASRAITLLIGKVQSQNEPVALRAIHIMDQCAKKCGKTFQSQIGKFRFLNELIKLVSPKYAGNQTPVAVRSAIVQQLKLWSSLYKDQPKLVEAYNMLDKTGNTKIKVMEKEFEYAVGEDADKAALLAQLLKSKNKQDLETANQMIKDMVAAESRKLEQDAELLKDVALIHNNGRLLAEMLANKDRTTEETQLLDELHKTCVGLRPKLYRLAGQLSDSAQLSSVVEAGETLNRAIEQYEQLGYGGAPPQLTAYQPPLIGQQSSSNMTSDTPDIDRESTTLINLEEDNVGAPGEKNKTMSADDFDSFLSSLPGTVSQPSSTHHVMTPNITTANHISTNGIETNTSGLFGGMTLQPQATVQRQATLQPEATVKPQATLFADQSVVVIHPTPSTTNDDFTSGLGLISLDTKAPSESTDNAVTGVSLLDDLFTTTNTPILQPTSSQPPPQPPTAEDKVVSSEDKFSDLLLGGLGELRGSAFPAPKAKPTLSQLSHQQKLTEPIHLLDPPTASSLQNRTEILLPDPSPASLLDPTPAPTRDILADVEVPLTLIKPAPVPPTLVYDSMLLRATLYTTENRPTPGVDVWLLTITNSSPTPIKNVKLEVTASDSGILRLLPPSSKELSPFSPICPASPIQQVLLTTNCSKMKYTLTYSSSNSIECKRGDVCLPV